MIHGDSRPRQRVALHMMEFDHDAIGATLVVAQFFARSVPSNLD